MSTTSRTSRILPVEINLRAAAAARAKFVAEAEAARNAMLRSNTGYAADEVHAYLRQRAVGAKSGKPKAKSWRD